MTSPARTVIAATLATLAATAALGVSVGTSLGDAFPIAEAGFARGHVAVVAAPR